MDEQGQRVVGDTLLMLLTHQPRTRKFRLPRHKPSERWVPVFDTSREIEPDVVYESGEAYRLEGRSVAVFVLKGGWPDTVNQLHEAHSKPPAHHTPT